MEKVEKKKMVAIFIKVLLAFVLSKFYSNKSSKKIVLIGGNLGEKYEDNAAVFHSYLVKNHSNSHAVYWLYNSATTYVKEKGIPNAVVLGSFQNYLLFFRADYSFHGHSIMYDIAPQADKFLFLNKKTIFTHISHGIEGFKKILIQKEDIPLLERTNYFNCASQHELEIKRDHWEIPEEKLIITGFPRFDRYPTNQPAKRVKNILFMTTWREWLVDLTDEELIASDYFASITKLLSHKKMNRLLKEHDVHITVALHPFMKHFEKHFQKLKSANIQFKAFDELSIGRSIEEMDMLLTDITSVSWDFLYLNKPIIFYLFDQEDLETKRGIYIDFDKDLYGYKAINSEEVVACLTEIIVDGVSYNKWYSEANRYIDFFDQDNCERLANRVLGLKTKQKKPINSGSKQVEKAS